MLYKKDLEGKKSILNAFTCEKGVFSKHKEKEVALGLNKRRMILKGTHTQTKTVISLLLFSSSVVSDSL